MRVLMLNRKDAHSVLGGDTVQMLRTKSALEELGVQIDVGNVQDQPGDGGYDLVHIFNWQQLEEYLAARKSSAQRPPLVLSTIFWFYTGHWFDTAAATKPMWRSINQMMGVARSRKLYEQWQQFKFRYGAEGKRLRQCLSVPAQLLPNSVTEAEHLESVLGMRGKLRPRCTIVPNAVARESFDPLPAPDQSFLVKYGLMQEFVLQVARIQEAKNQLGLIEALYDLPVPIVFVGQPSPYEQDYVQRCHDLANKRGRVCFLGPMSGEELVKVYASAAVHVLPSWRETPGLASLEAAATGCPIVSTSIGSTREYFGDLAWYCDPRDSQSIRLAVLGALKSSRTETLRNVVLERYTWQAAAAATLKAYHVALDGENRKRGITNE